jgi:hypothetical protein
VDPSWFILDDSLQNYLTGITLDLLASALLVWATAGVKRWPLRRGLASALFGGRKREPKELANIPADVVHSG